PHATLISDGACGAIITWEDYRDYPIVHIYAQHVDAGGRSVWNPGGVLLSNPGSDQQEPNIVADGHGGALLSWVDYLNQSGSGIFSQRIDSSGTALWTPGGALVAVGPGPRIEPVALVNPDGDFVVAWSDCRTGPSQNGGSD